MEKSRTVTIPESWVELAGTIRNLAERGAFYHAICCYILGKKPPVLFGLPATYFAALRPTLDRSMRNRKS